MELVLLVEVVVREFIVFVTTGGIGTIGRSGSQGIHSICKTGGIGTIGRSGSQGIHSICKLVELVLLVEVVVREFIVFVNWWNWYYW